MMMVWRSNYYWTARPSSATGCRFVDNSAVQPERNHAIVAQLPDPSLWIPRPTGLRRPAADGHIGQGAGALVEGPTSAIDQPR